MIQAAYAKFSLANWAWEYGDIFEIQDTEQWCAQNLQEGQKLGFSANTGTHVGVWRIVDGDCPVNVPFLFLKSNGVLVMGK